MGWAKRRTPHNKRQCLSAWNEAFWSRLSRLYGLNFISVSTEQCLLDWPVCFCSVTSVASVKWWGKEWKKRGKGKLKVITTPQENKPIKSYWDLKNRKLGKSTILKKICPSQWVVFTDTSRTQEECIWKALKALPVFDFSVPLWSLMFSTAGRVFLRGITDTAEDTSPFWLSNDWGLPHCPSDPWLGLGGLGGGAQDDSELEEVKALWFLSNVRGIW